MGALKTDAAGTHETMGHIFDADAFEVVPGRNPLGQGCIVIGYTSPNGECTSEVALTPAAALQLIRDLAVAYHQVGVAGNANDEMVDHEDRCENCGNRSKDELIWIENGVDGEVECGRCGHHYRITHA